MPRHQADITSSPAPGNRIRTSVIVSSRFSPSKPGAISEISSGVARTPTSDEQALTRPRTAATAPATSDASDPVSAREQRGVDRDERARERAFAEEVLQEIGDPERRA